MESNCGLQDVSGKSYFLILLVLDSHLPFTCFCANRIASQRSKQSMDLLQGGQFTWTSIIHCWQFLRTALPSPGLLGLQSISQDRQLSTTCKMSLIQFQREILKRQVGQVGWILSPIMFDKRPFDIFQPSAWNDYGIYYTQLGLRSTMDVLWNLWKWSCHCDQAVHLRSSERVAHLIGIYWNSE